MSTLLARIPLYEQMQKKTTVGQWLVGVVADDDHHHLCHHPNWRSLVKLLMVWTGAGTERTLDRSGFRSRSRSRSRADWSWNGALVPVLLAWIRRCGGGRSGGPSSRPVCCCHSAWGAAWG